MPQQIEQLTTWLNSAYAMEESLAHVLENHAKDAEEFPDVRSRLQLHVEQTRRHADRVKECLTVLGETPSAAKSIIGNVTGMVQGVSTGMFHDEIVKNFLADYASEHFEIASYRSLIAAAEELGQPQIVALCRENLRDEEAMSAWIEEMIPEVTRMFLQRQPAGT